MTLHRTPYGPDSDPITIWIVDDQEDYRLTIQELINERQGMRCPQALASCEELFAALNQEFAPEVILMDIVIPDRMDGIEGVRRMKGISPATQIVMLTMHSDNDKIFDAICAGASGYLLKMSSQDRIFEAIEEAVRGGVVMDAKIARRVLTMFAQFSKPQYDYDLSEREKEVLQHLVDGKTKNGIADALYLSFHTIDTHMRNIYAKLHVHSRSGAVAKALKERIV